jgi:hypothetical protein
MPFLVFVMRVTGRFRREARKPPTNQRPAKLMHRHGNPNGEVGKAFDGNAALQFTAGSCDDLAAWSAGEALACMLYVICSL